MASKTTLGRGHVDAPSASPPKATVSSSTEGLPVAPSMGPALDAIAAARQSTNVDLRAVYLTGLSISVGVASALVAQILLKLIGFITGVAFYGRFSLEFASPTYNHLGAWVIPIPVLGGIVVGLMARYGSAQIRGHGIPEVMETVLTNKSRIPPRVTFLKPVSAAIAIGTGGPFGAEGPIIATGGALGSLLGQLLETTAEERKILLSAGAAAGMSATFGSPVSAVLLAVELLLFEFSPRSLIAVIFASVTAAAVRTLFMGTKPIFAMPALPQPTNTALIMYTLLGAVVGVASVYVTRAVYAVEDNFDRLPVHWMWWPAIGAIACGIVGYIMSQTLGVGYDNIEHVTAGNLAVETLGMLCVLKFVSWAISLGSGTSGGTLAPLFTIGGSLGSVLAAALLALSPRVGVDVRMAGLIGMAAMFAGASRALLASVVFAFETTLESSAVLPLLSGCVASYLVSSLLMKYTIMTEKVARRGIDVPVEYFADFLSQVRVGAVATRKVVTLSADSTVGEVRSWIAEGRPGSNHQGYPVIDSHSLLVGVVTRRNILDPNQMPIRRIAELISKPPAVVFEENTMRQASDLMVREKVGRLPVVAHDQPRKIIGIISRSDIMSVDARRLQEIYEAGRTISFQSVFGQKEAEAAESGKLLT